MKNTVLENEYLRVAISAQGAEMRSILNKRNNTEQLWHGAAAVWQDRAPWLFPMIGQLRNGSYRMNGKSYAMPMHGFASKAIFDTEQISDQEVAFTLCANADTLAVFPWKFCLKIRYCLSGSDLLIDCAVSCLDNEDMYFSFGAHPGFLCAPGDTVFFPEDTALCCQRLDEATHLLLPETENIPPAIILNEALFDDDAMLLRTPNSTYAELKRADGTGVRFSFGKTTWVGLWSRAKAGLPYICIEPWHGVDDPINATGELTEKQDIVHLPAGKTFEMHLCISPF